MHPQEVWWLIEARRPKQFYGKLSEEEAEECYQEIIEEEELAGLEHESGQADGYYGH
jgi:hypothetical protein